jgi:hypothetical protein
MATKDRIVKLVATNSMLSTFLDCRMRFVWRYMRELVPITSSVPLIWGDLGHRLLEVLYASTLPNIASTSTEIDLSASVDAWIAEKVAGAMGAIELQPFADQFAEMQIEETREQAREIADEVLDVIQYYIGARYDEDVERYTFHMVEKTFNVPLPTIDGRRLTNTSFAGKWDLVATDKETGVCKLWDHKFSVRNLNELQIEGDTDTQPLGYLYAASFLSTAKARQLRPGDRPLWSSAIPMPKGFVHNWIRRSVPSEPPLLKNRKQPTLSKSKQLVTTAALYRDALAKHNIDPTDYADHLQWLEENEQSFVRRTEPNIEIQEIEKWLEETTATVRDVRLVMRDERQAYRNPRACRRLGRGRCPYIPLCFGESENPSVLAQFRHERAHIELGEQDEEENGG